MQAFTVEGPDSSDDMAAVSDVNNARQFSPQPQIPSHHDRGNSDGDSGFRLSNVLINGGQFINAGQFIHQSTPQGNDGMFPYMER